VAVCSEIELPPGASNHSESSSHPVAVTTTPRFSEQIILLSTIACTLNQDRLVALTHAHFPASGNGPKI
jgi:hypothetical protein